MKILYAIILGVMLATFIGVGIEAFYPTKQYPQPPAAIQYKTTPVNTPEDIKLQQDYDNTVKDFQEKNSKHNRNVSMIAIGASVIFMFLSLTILTKANFVFADGFLIGSLLTLLYGIIRGFDTNDNKFRFIIVTIGLAIALILGYIKFVKDKK